MQLRIFHRGLLRTAPGLVRTCEIFENWGNPWQSLESLSYPVKDLESLSCPGKDLSPLECQYGPADKRGVVQKIRKMLISKPFLDAKVICNFIEIS